MTENALESTQYDRSPESKWREREEFLLSIHKHDAQELLKLAKDHRHMMDINEPMFVKVHMDTIHKIMTRVRRRVIREACLWVGLFVAMAAGIVTAFLMMR